MNLSPRGVADAHDADRVELALLDRVLGGALARLIALVEQLDLLQFLEGFAKLRLGFVELRLQVVDRAAKIFSALGRSLRIGWISKMGGIVDSGTILLGLDLAFEVDAHAVELGDHGFDLRRAAAL